MTPSIPHQPGVRAAAGSIKPLPAHRIGKLLPHLPTAHTWPQLSTAAIFTPHPIQGLHGLIKPLPAHRIGKLLPHLPTAHTWPQLSTAAIFTPHPIQGLHGLIKPLPAHRIGKLLPHLPTAHTWPQLSTAAIFTYGPHPQFRVAPTPRAGVLLTGPAAPDTGYGMPAPAYDNSLVNWLAAGVAISTSAGVALLYRQNKSRLPQTRTINGLRV